MALGEYDDAESLLREAIGELRQRYDDDPKLDWRTGELCYLKTKMLIV